MLVDDHVSVRSAGAQSMLEGVACCWSAYVAGRWVFGSPSCRIARVGYAHDHAVVRMSTRPRRESVASPTIRHLALPFGVVVQGTPDIHPCRVFGIGVGWSSDQLVMV